MTQDRYWVVGGKFDSLAFDRIIDGTQRVLGPFKSSAEAETAWRSVSNNHRHECAMRFLVLVEPAARALAAA